VGAALDGWNGGRRTWGVVSKVILALLNLPLYSEALAMEFAMNRPQG